MLDTLYDGDDNEVHDRTLLLFLNGMLRFLDKAAHGLAYLAAGTDIHLFQCLFKALDLNLGLVDVKGNAVAQGGALAFLSAFCMQRRACFSAL
jgi:hypothetical protein